MPTRNNNQVDPMAPFKTKETVEKSTSVPTGNYEFTVDKIELHPEGPNIKMFMHDENYQLVHTIFPKHKSSIDYHRNTIGQQLNLEGQKLDLIEVLQKSVGCVLKVYVSYNERGRSVAFGVRKAPEVIAEATPIEEVAGAF